MVHRQLGRSGCAALALAIVLLGGRVGAGPLDRTAIPRQVAAPSHHPADPSANKSDAERIAAALESKNRYDQSTQGQRDAHQAAEGARRAAHWAGAMFWVALLEALVTATGVILVFFTLREARNSAREAKRAADEMKRSADATSVAAQAAKASSDAAVLAADAASRQAAIAEETERPYILANTLGIMKRALIGNPPVQVPFIDFSVANYGKTPALLHRVRGTFAMAEVLAPELRHDNVAKGETQSQESWKWVPMASGEAVDIGEFWIPASFEIGVHSRRVQPDPRGPKRLFLFLDIQFEDMQGRVFDAHTCWQWDHQIGFRRAGGPTYNYETRNRD
jgi:hypothetical protein